MRAHTGERLRERREVVAPIHLPTPAPITGLEHDRVQRLRHSSSLPDVDRRRMRDIATPKHAGGQQLVVGREQRRGVIQDVDATGGECPERPEPVVHAVERRKHVQTTERSVPGAQNLERTAWSHRLPAEAVAGRIRERVVRRRRAAGDERKSHEASVAAARARGQGVFTGLLPHAHPNVARPVGLVGSRP